MSLRYHIFPDHGLVYVRYSGFVRISQTMQAFAQFAADPAAKTGSKQLVDLTRVTGYEANYAEIMKIQMSKAEVFLQGSHETLLVYVANNEQNLKFANFILRSWDGIDGVAARVLQSEAEALQVLGLPELTVADLDAAIA